MKLLKKIRHLLLVMAMVVLFGAIYIICPEAAYVFAGGAYILGCTLFFIILYEV